jgi:hypothetical protein
MLDSPRLAAARYDLNTPSGASAAKVSAPAARSRAKLMGLNSSSHAFHGFQRWSHQGEWARLCI